MRILLWHIHGSWTTAFVQGSHTYLVPVLPGRGPDGRGRAQTWEWPVSVEEVSPSAARHTDIDAVIVQRPQELEGMVCAWTGRRPGRDVPAVYVEHNTPEGPISDMIHPAANHPEVTVAHVTHFNRLFWDTGPTRAVVIEHAVVDPGYRYEGTLPRAAAVINEPVRRGRVTGTDLLVALRAAVPIDLFGMASEPLDGVDLRQSELHRTLPRRRVYFHPNRWTSLGLSLIEAMQLGMPVVALATTEAVEAVPTSAGVLSNRPALLAAALSRLISEPDEAREMGACARRYALTRYGLPRFLADWDGLLEEVTA
jgi:glycosyltransferase involved in cell wall biosynthesis